MALVKYDPLVTKIRGSISEVTFSAARAGETIRRRAYPRDPHSFRQAPYRQHFIEAIAQWHGVISDAQKIVWNTLGDNTTLSNSAGDSYNPSGFNLATGCNVLYLTCGQAMIATAPAAARFNAPTFSPVFCEDNLVKIQDDATWSDPLTGWVHILESPPLSPAVFGYSGPWALNDIHTIAEFHAAAWVNINTQVDWIVGRKYFWKLKAIKTLGAISYYTILSAICVAH